MIPIGIGTLEKFFSYLNNAIFTLMIKMLIPAFLLLSYCSMAQDAYTSYRISDSLYRAKDYKAAAAANMSGIRADKVKDNPTRYAYAAGAWAKADMPDSAFAALYPLINSNRISLPFLRGLTNNRDLAVLKNDPRWTAFMDKATTKASGNYKVEEMVYGRKEGLALTMLQLSPAGKANSKAIIRVVAGSWYSNYDMAESYIMGSYEYLQNGFTVFHVIVGTQPRYNIPEQIADVKRAVRYIRYNASKLGIDPNKMGIEGGSAGGHLSLSVALADEQINEKAPDPVDRVSSRVQAVAILYPPTDFMNWGAKGFNFINSRQIMEQNKVWGSVDFKTFQESTMTYIPVTDTAERNKLGREISPIYAVSADDPPVFIMHGDADPTVPIQQSLWLVEKMKAAGVKNHFIMKPGGKHNPNDMLPEWGIANTSWFLEWLK
jgi:acetyl esterase/lipase